MIFVILAVCLHGASCESGRINWGYHKGMNFSSPDHWKDLPGTSCGGVRQSPINIVTSRTSFSEALKPVHVSRRQSTATVVLETHVTSLYLTFGSLWNITFGGEGCLRPLAIHWHWGLHDGRGSEHTVDGHQYAMEGHLVTFNCHLYNNSADAIKSENGLYVFGVFYKIGDANPALSKIQSLMDVVINTKSTTTMEVNPRAFLPNDLSSYYRYEGSLTTPPCTENVIWTVFREIQTISPTQLFKLRSLQYAAPESGPMGDNFRPVIPTDARRVVLASFNKGSVPKDNVYLSFFLLLAYFICIHPPLKDFQ